MKKRRIMLSLLTAAALFACSSGGDGGHKSDHSAKTPTPEDRMQTLMAKAQMNIDDLNHGIMNFKKDVVERSTANLIAYSQYLANKTEYQSKGTLAEWEAYCAQQETLCEQINQSYKDEDYSDATTSLGKLIHACVECHKPYRFGRY